MSSFNFPAVQLPVQFPGAKLTLEAPLPSSPFDHSKPVTAAGIAAFVLVKTKKFKYVEVSQESIKSQQDKVNSGHDVVVASCCRSDRIDLFTE